MLKKFIEVTFRKAGVHCYPSAATEPCLEPVAYLANMHRHMFHFSVRIEVFHSDREIEFIMLKAEIESLYKDDILQLNNKSCEMIAEDLINVISNRYPGRDIIVKVAEDGENAAILEYWE
jgi:hypothetical protein